ncbi:hypothetical protein P8452_73993 [Trifolium repens]|nr:hypothetical protein P8452_73993 [Trifolium repens]
MWEKQPLRKTHRRTSVKFSYALRFIKHVENQKSNPIKTMTEQPKSTKNNMGEEGQEKLSTMVKEHSNKDNFHLKDKMKDVRTPLPLTSRQDAEESRRHNKTPSRRYNNNNCS